MKILAYLTIGFLFLLLPEKALSALKSAKVDFYGLKETVRYDESLTGLTIPQEVNFNFIKVYDNYYRTKVNLKPTVEDIRAVRDKNHFSDSDLLVFINKLSDKIFLHQSLNTKVFFRWNILYNLHYDVLLVFIQGKLVIDANSSFREYSYSRSEFEKEEYAEIDGYHNDKSGGFSVFKLASEQKKDLISFSFSLDEPKIKPHYVERLYEFEFDSKTYTIRAWVDSNRAHYYSHFPPFKLGRHLLEIPVSDSLRSTLLEPLKKIMNQVAKGYEVDFLLRFAQQVAQYKTDQEYWGYERFMLPEQTLLYRVGDCDDNAILFSFLVKELLKIPTILIDYNGSGGHVNTGVFITPEMQVWDQAKTLLYEGENILSATLLLLVALAM